MDSKISLADYAQWFQRVARWFERKAKKQLDKDTIAQFERDSLVFHPLGVDKTLVLGLGDIEPEHLEEVFGLKITYYINGPWWSLKDEPFFPQSEHIEPVVEATRYTVGALAVQLRSELVAKVTTVLCLTLDQFKRDERRYYPDEKTAGRLFLRPEKYIGQIITYQEQKRYLSGYLDFVLWWGNPSELETNLIVIVAEHGQVKKQLDALLTTVLMIHSARKTTQRQERCIYGIATDSEEWYIACMDDRSMVHVMDEQFEEKPTEIINQIRKILRLAAELVPTRTRQGGIAPGPSVSRITGCRITGKDMDLRMDEEFETAYGIDGI
ncbi:hypothetical protein BJX76DRAFT_356094 [Aspergillus varians]